MELLVVLEGSGDGYSGFSDQNFDFNGNVMCVKKNRLALCKATCAANINCFGMGLFESMTCTFPTDLFIA